MAELADAPHSKCGGAIRAGSSPATGTRIFSPELTEFRAFLLPDSLYSGVLRVKCENRICRRNLAAIIKVGVNIRCRSDVAMSQPLLDVPQTDTVGVKKAGTAMAEIVETDFFQSVVFQYNLEMLCDEVWFDKFAHCIYIDIIQIFFAVGCTAYLLIDKLLLFQAPQQFFKGWDQRQGPVTGLRFRSVLLYGDVLAIHIDLRNGVLYADCLFFKVNRIPFQSDYLAPPQSVKCGKNTPSSMGSPFTVLKRISSSCWL